MSREGAALRGVGGVESDAKEKRGSGVSSKATFYQLSEAAYLQGNPQEADWYRQRIADRERLKVELRACSAEIQAFRAKIRSYNRDRKRRQEREEKPIRDELSREGPPAAKPPRGPLGERIAETGGAPVFPSILAPAPEFSDGELSEEDAAAASEGAGAGAMEESSKGHDQATSTPDPPIQPPSRMEPLQPETSLESGRPLGTLEPEGTSVTTAAATPTLAGPATDVVAAARRPTAEDPEHDFKEILAAMSPVEWERRVIAALAECKADPMRYPQWRSGSSWTMQQRYAIGERRARDTLRAELERKASSV